MNIFCTVHTMTSSGINRTRQTLPRAEVEVAGFIVHRTLSTRDFIALDHHTRRRLAINRITNGFGTVHAARTSGINRLNSSKQPHAPLLPNPT